MSLTKNMFVGAAAPTFVRRMLGSRLEAFEQVRARFDPTGVLRTRYGREVLGLSEASPGPRTWT
jgi:FAD/FMN-containing dehydrogenase